MMKPSDATLEYRSVDFSYYRKNKVALKIVDNFSLKVAPQALMVLLGPSGCGKSTLLRLGAGLLTPDQGEIRVSVTGSGQPLDECVYLPQRNALFPWLNAKENIQFALEYRSSFQHIDRAEQFLHEVGLAGLDDHYPAQLSGGQQQRVSLARTFASGRPVLLLDEPFSSLDQLTQWQMQDLLVRLWEIHEHTVLLVTHDVEEAIYLADELVILSDRPTYPLWRTPVNFERPRSRDLRTSHEFIDFRRTVENRLLDRTTKV